MSFGRLERRPSAQPMSDINMTPLVDVMLVLLVIFMLTAPLLTSSIKLELPKSEASKPGQTPQFVTLVIDKNGHIFLKDQAFDLGQLAQQLSAIAQSNPDTEVQLRADAALPYGRLVEVMGVAQKAGLNHIGFVTDETRGNQMPTMPTSKPRVKP